MTAGDPSSRTGEGIETVLDEFCEAWFAGKRPDPEVFCNDHPECGPELRQRIATFLDAAHSMTPARDGDGPEDGQSKSDDDTVREKILGDYRVIEEIGRGGMARVYEAEQISLKRRVALKILSPHLSFSRQAVQKFQREAEAGSRQTHPGIVSVFAVGSFRGTHYIAQELVAGARTVADRLEQLRKEPALPRGHFRQVAEMIVAVAGAVAHAHRSGVIHRDLKPSNILLADKDEPKVTDFGLARVEGALALSQSGDFAGTPYYMSPEQARSSRSAIDRRTDIYSLGVTLYEALTLSRPFDGDTSHEVIKKILLNEPKEPRRVNARVPRDLAVICLEAMEKDPSRRYQSMEELAEDLDRFLEGEPILARPSGRISRALKWVRRHKLISLAAGTLVAALGAVAILLLVVLLEQRQALELALRKFKPVQEALVWADVYSHRAAHTWCMMATPNEPAPYIMKGLLDIELINFNSAVGALDQGLKRFPAGKPSLLETEARYLMAVAKFRQAQTEPDKSRTRQALLDEAREWLPADGDFEFASPDALFLRHREDRAGEGDVLEMLRQPLRVNTEHFMIHLYQGMLIFDDIYKGGDSHEFGKAVGFFTNVLKQKPHNVAALSYLGRIYYFLARFYNLMTLTESALDLLERARFHSDGNPHHMIDTTIGQIHVLLGNDRLAMQHFEKSINRAEGLERARNHIHNSYRGQAKVLVRSGDFESAWSNFEIATRGRKFDYHNNIAIAEFFFCKGDLDRAMEYARRGTQHLVEGPLIKTKAESGVAAAHLTCARLLFARGEHEQIGADLNRIWETNYVSPRELSLACFFVVGIIDEVTNSRDEWDDMAVFAEGSAEKSIDNAHFGGRKSPFGPLRSPISLAAVGAAHYLNKEYGEAIVSIEKALEVREGWSPQARRYYWMDRARDFYLLAMTHRALAGQEPAANAEHEKKAREYFRRAEADWASNDLPYENADINRLIRQRARRIMGAD